MEIKNTSFPVADAIENLKNKRLRINKDYQRSPGIWPQSAKSYFIDSILEGFPYPQIYLYYNFDKERKLPYSEVIDGQQRLTTILDFHENKFRLTKESKKFVGMYFKDLDEDTQDKFLKSSIDASQIISGSRPEVLEMFRRMNAYTVPLNAPEKRHARFNGEFKWFVTETADTASKVFEEYGVISPPKILRFFDMELITELCLILDSGIQTKNAKALDAIYKKYDDAFHMRGEYETKIREFLESLSLDFSLLKGTKILSQNNFHDLFAAFMHMKYGIFDPSGQIGEVPVGRFYEDLEKARNGLEKLSASIEIESEEDWVKDFVVSAKRSTTKRPERLTKVRYMIKALKGQFA